MSYDSEFEPSRIGPGKNSMLIAPKMGSNSEILFHSELSAIDSGRPSSLLARPPMKKETSARSLKFKNNSQNQVQVAKANSMKLSKFQEVKNNGAQLQQFLQPLLLKFKDKFLQSTKYLWKSVPSIRKERLETFFSIQPTSIVQEPKEKIHSFTISGRLKLRVIEPQDKFAKFWDLIALLITAFTLWLSPFVATFSLLQVTTYQILICGILIFSFADALIICNKAIIVNGELVLNRKKIIKEYMRTYIWGDVFTLLVWIILLQDVQEVYIREVLSFIQCTFIGIRLNTRLNNYIDCLYMKGNVSEFVDLIILVGSLFFCIHIIACYWTFVGFSTEYLGKNWLIKNSVADLGYWQQYNVAFYWATMTMVTVGYGDVTAANGLEVLYSNVIMFFSSLVFAYSINSIGMILKNIQVNQNTYKKQLILINQYMNNNQVKQSIQARVVHYLKHYAENEQQSNTQEVYKIIENLPVILQEELKQDIKQRIFSNIDVLNQFSSSTQLQAAKSLEIISYLPKDMIFSNQSQQEQYLYYIESGEVTICESRTKQLIQVLKEGCYFNQYSFFTNINLPITAISTTFTSIYKISRSNFLQTLQFHRVDFEKFHHIKDFVIYNNDTKILGLRCNICEKTSHLNINCPAISYQPSIEKLVKSEYFITQKRKKITRSDRGKMNSLYEYHNIDQSVKYYQQGEEQIEPQIISEEISQNTIQKLNPSSTTLQEQSKQEQFIQQKSAGSQFFKQKSSQFCIEKNQMKNSFRKSTQNLETEPIQNQKKPIIQRHMFQTSDLIEDTYQFHHCDIDAILKSQTYLPQNNQNAVLLSTNNIRKRAKENLSYHYTFSTDVAKYCTAKKSRSKTLLREFETQNKDQQIEINII